MKIATLNVMLAGIHLVAGHLAYHGIQHTLFVLPGVCDFTIIDDWSSDSWACSHFWLMS
jgi:hypothetical protein